MSSSTMMLPYARQPVSKPNGPAMTLKKALKVSVHQVSSEGMSRGVIYGCPPYETSETLAEALDNQNVSIPLARPMEKSGSVLITFASSRPPRYLKYWDFLKNVVPCEPRSMACFRCNGLGHKHDVCPTEMALCPRCGCQYEEPPESCPPTDKKYCRNREKDGHLATHASCPQRKLFAKHANAGQ
ncbi:hypothetical protein HPB49_025936 [Dermacentor silvarum]|nr:hypothetical protein HPB49_025936 [Dermacentor silvarum]